MLTLSSQYSHRRHWTKSEDELLTALIASHGSKRGKESESNWTEVSKHLPRRTNKDCRKRWFHSLDPSLRKGRWTEEEDQIILSAYERLGPSWKAIAALLDGRKDDQVAKRYNDILSPSVRHRLSNWTSEEDQYLATQVTKYGHRWAAISAGLPGRPPLTCRNRWRYLKRVIYEDGAGESASGTEQASSSDGNARVLEEVNSRTNYSPATSAGGVVDVDSVMNENALDFTFIDPVGIGLDSFERTTTPTSSTVFHPDTTGELPASSSFPFPPCSLHSDMHRDKYVPIMSIDDPVWENEFAAPTTSGHWLNGLNDNTTTPQDHDRVWASLTQQHLSSRPIHHAMQISDTGQSSIELTNQEPLVQNATHVHHHFHHHHYHHHIYHPQN